MTPTERRAASPPVMCGAGSKASFFFKSAKEWNLARRSAKSATAIDDVFKSADTALHEVPHRRVLVALGEVARGVELETSKRAHKIRSPIVHGSFCL